MLTKLLAQFPDYTVVDRPTPDLIARYRDRVPPELLAVWEQYGLGTFRAGYLKIVNPDDYADLLADTYQLTSTPAPAGPVVLFATALGDLVIWEIDFLSLVNYRHGTVSIIGKRLKFFLQDLTDEVFLTEKLMWEPYLEARARLGEPAFDECFGYVPLLALGGPETADHLERAKLREHIALIGQFTGVLER